MKHAFLLVFLVSAFLGSCQTKRTAVDFQKMDWLVGTWKGVSDGQVFYEQWRKASDTEFDNVNYSICGGDTIRGGSARIVMKNGKIFYTDDQFAWDLIDITDSVIVFDNPERAERFTFSKMSGGDWNAVLQYGQRKVEYQLSRSPSIAALLQQKRSVLEGYYEGAIEFMGKNLSTSIRFFHHDARQTATVTTPSSLQLDMPADEVCYDSPFVRLRLRDGAQFLELSAEFYGDSIKGRLTGEIPATVSLKRSTIAQKQPGYHIVSFTVKNEGVVLPADLYVPDKGEPAGVVVMIPGSGRHIKEEYKGWADVLASRGVAVLTYTKRNVSAISGLQIRNASSDIALPGQLESDIAAIVGVLKKRSDINPRKIGLFGFSQGAVFAPVVASQDTGISFIVAVSGNVTTDKEYIIYQSVNRLKQQGFGEAAVSETISIWNELFRYARDKKDGDRIQRKLDLAYQEGFGQAGLPRQLPNDDEIRYLTTWNSFEHDPAPYWRNLSVPAYVVFGGKDLYIPVERSSEILEKLYKDRSPLLTLKVYPDANHFIKKIIDRNNFDFPRFADHYVQDLVSWIQRQAR
jgi:dienelactone hydrolase